MRLKLIRIFIITLIISLLIQFTGGIDLANFRQTARAVSADLTIDWGVPSGNPIFTTSNMAPGQVESRSVSVSNNSNSPRNVGVKIGDFTDTDLLSSQLEILITEGATTVYGPHTLSEFIAETQGPAGDKSLSVLGAHSSTTYNFTVTFKTDAGNAWQNKNLTFDLILGLAYQIPNECQNIEFTGAPIIGTARAETLRGTGASELIMGLEGADKIDGGGGDDCILGGTGADKIEAGGGNDVVFGGEGADNIKGGTGNDILSGEEGADSLEGGTENDQLIGGNGADNLDGGSGNDLIIGEGGVDTMKGGSGNDTLLGGTANDKANGGSDIDACEAESKTQCES